MDNQYSYYTPGQDDFDYQPERRGGQGSRNKKGVPSIVKVIGLALVFGVVASAAFQVSNLAAGKLLKNVP